ncbi:unnamed protein product [Ectocarpus sp. 8 AP-2014]
MVEQRRKAHPPSGVVFRRCQGTPKGFPLASVRLKSGSMGRRWKKTSSTLSTAIYA